MNRLVARDDAPAVNLDAGHAARLGSGGNDDSLRLEFLLLVAGDGDLAVPEQAPRDP